jgi:methyltransferase (TIGR00027 family)
MPIENVSDTAFWVAHYRAVETSRKDAFFKDPLAGVLAGEKGAKIANEMSRSRYTAWSLVIRTVIIDAYIQKLVASGEIDAVLNLGAGLDTRPYRLALPSDFPWIEVDFPHVIEFKEQKLKQEAPLFKLERMKLDLTSAEKRDAFLSGISNRFKKVLVLTEGVVPYLTNDDVASLAESLKRQENFKYWVLDYFSAAAVQFLIRTRSKEMQKAPFRFEPKNWFEFFGRHGWQLHEMRYLGEESRRLKRKIPSPLRMKIIRLLLSAEQRKKMDQFTGYAILKRG